MEGNGFKQTEIVITFLVGLLAVIVAIVMVLLQEYYKQVPPNLSFLVFNLIIGIVTYFVILAIILIFLWRGLKRKDINKAKLKRKKKLKLKSL